MSGAKIIAHENVKKRLGMRITMGSVDSGSSCSNEGQPSIRLPEDRKDGLLGGLAGPCTLDSAHTDGDNYVFFPGPNVLHTGDLLFTGHIPGD